MGVEEEYGLLPNLRQMRAEEIRRGLGLVGQVVGKVDFWPALPVYHVTGEDLLKEQAHGQGCLSVVGAGLYEIAQAEVCLKLLNDTDEVRVNNDAAADVIMQVTIEALGVLAELLPQSIDFSGGQLAGFPFLDLVVDEPVEQRLPHRRLLEHFQHRESSVEPFPGAGSRLFPSFLFGSRLPLEMRPTSSPLASLATMPRKRKKDRKSTRL